MSVLEIAGLICVGYLVLLLLLEAVVWKTQPDMENGVTVFVRRGDETFQRKLYGFDYRGRLYVSSNHWFRQWYHAVLDHPDVDVAHQGTIKPYTAVAIHGDERAEIAREYKMRFVLRLMCGFAPRRFLRFDPRGEEEIV